MANYNDGPAMVGIQLTPALYDYFVKLLQLGIFQGPIGTMQINPAVMPFMEAIHNVLAGGAATATITTPGTPAVVQKLDDLVSDGVTQGNTINQKLGFYMAAIP